MVHEHATPPVERTLQSRRVGGGRCKVHRLPENARELQVLRHLDLHDGDRLPVLQRAVAEHSAREAFGEHCRAEEG